MVPLSEKTVTIYVAQDHELDEILGLQETWVDLFIPHGWLVL